jgi:hypothetical protein
VHTFDTMHKEHYYFPNHTGMTSRECEMTFQLRTVPGQTLQSVTADVKRLLEGIKKDHPAFDCTLTIPATQPEGFWCQDPMEDRSRRSSPSSMRKRPQCRLPGRRRPGLRPRGARAVSPPPAGR